ncbi:MAG: hypothetical protein WD646_14900 [Actinomycetota bacterium]
MSVRQKSRGKAQASSPGDGLKLGDGVATTVGIVAGCAGVLHLLASRDHLDHPLIAASFVVLALAQIGWAALVVWQRSSRLLTLGILGNLAVVGVWAFSRTTGIPFYEPIASAEPVGIADATATMFEIIAALGAGLLLILPSAARVALVPRQRGQRFMAGAGALALLLLVPAFVTEGHAHDHGEEVRVAGASHTHEATEVAEAVHAHPETALAEAASHSAPGHDHAAVEALAASVPHGHADGTSHADTPGHVADHAHQEDAQAPPAVAAPPAPKPRGQPATMLYGPFLLNASDQGGMDHYNRILPLVAPCVNCLITSIRPDLVYADGSSANLDTGPMLHHTVLADPFRPDPTCARDEGVGIVGHRLFAAGNERTSGMLPEGYGFSNQSPIWIGIFEIMNHAPTSKLVLFKIDITYVPMSDPSTKAAVPIWLDVDNCADSQFGVPKGESHTKWKWKSNLTGRIVGAGGHVHNGGISITLSNATKGELMCTSLAGYGTKPAYMGSVESMSICQHDRIGTVRAGEDLLLDTYYNMSAAANDVMGIMIAYVYETTDLSGGGAPPAAYTAPPPDDAPPPHADGGHAH